MRFTSRLILAATLLFALLPPAGAAAEPAQPAEIRLRVTTPAYSLDGQGPRVPGYTIYSAPGAPALPVWRTVIELPPSGAWTISYTAEGEQVLAAPAALPAAPAPQLDHPGPGPATDLPDLPARAQLVARPDPTIYAADAFYPAAPVVAGDEGWQRGRRLLALDVFPFQYNPVRGELRYYPDLRITITMVDMSGAGGDLADENGAEHPERSRGRGPGAVEGCGATSCPGPHPSTGHDSLSTLARRPAQDANTFTAQPALRITTDRRGMHRLTYGDLAAAGAPVADVDPASLAMWYGDELIASEVTGAEDGRFDPGDLVIFYAEPYTGRYMTQNVYWLTWGGEAGARMAQRAAAPSGALTAASAITQTARVEYDRVYYSDYKLPAEHDRFFDNSLYVMQPPGAATTAVTYTFGLDDLVTAGRARLRAALYGGKTQAADPDQSVAVAVNGQVAGVYQWKGSVLHTVADTLPAAWLSPATQVKLEAALAQLPGLASYWVVPDWVEISYPALADAEEDRLYIEGVVSEAATPPPHRLYLPLINSGSGSAPPASAPQVTATGFTTADVRVYDIRDPQRPVRLTGAGVTPAGGAYTVGFSDPALATGRYWLATGAGLLAPVAVAADAPSAWRTADHAADYIAVVHRSLWDAIQPLLDHRAAEGLRIAKVDVQDIYDEWSGGLVDPEAIRSFLARAYRHWNAGGAPPTYVLLVGDGHYDFKNVRRTNLPNLVPPYLLDIDPWIGETAADNRFVAVDGPDDYLPDMAVGRIPARNPADVTAVVNKILAYETTATAGPWQSRAVFVADDFANRDGNFHALSDEVRLNDVPAGYETPRLYYRLDETLDTAAEMRTAIRGAFNSGALLVQWFGHASKARWGSVDMFNTTDAPALVSNTTWPLTASYACWSGYFINMSIAGGYGSVQTLAEQLLLTPGRGSLADFSPSGLHIGAALVTLDRGMTRAILHDRQARVGLAADAARQYVYAASAAWHDVIDTQILFGDPATRLRLPPAPP